MLEEISEISGIDSAYGTMFNIAYPAEINGEERLSICTLMEMP